MARIPKTVEIIILDGLGVLLMILALLTGWLPGPGGIPLFIIGLSLLAVNHEWANKYISILKRNAHRIGEFIFTQNHYLQIFYDLLWPLLMVAGIYLLMHHSSLWKISLGLGFVGLSVTIFLGNRSRLRRLTQHIKHKK